MEATIRRLCIVREETFERSGKNAGVPLCKIGVVAVIGNPYAGRYVEDLQPMIDASATLGREMARRLVEALGPLRVQSYGKAAIVGTSGEQEHANALISTTFANPFRDAIGGGQAWISSVTKMASLGTLVDVPLNHKDDVYVRSHYDVMTIGLGDSPRPDEIAVIFCVANRGRLNARVGGLSHEEVLSRRGSSR